MSLTLKRTLSYTAAIWIVFAILAVIPIAYAAGQPVEVANAEPLPWWQQVEKFQDLAVKWVGALTIVFTALAGFVAFLIAKYQELSGRLHRSDLRAQSLADVTAATARTAALVAQAIADSKPKQVEVVNEPSHPVPVIEPKQ